MASVGSTADFFFPFPEVVRPLQNGLSRVLLYPLRLILRRSRLKTSLLFGHGGGKVEGEGEGDGGEWCAVQGGGGTAGRRRLLAGEPIHVVVVEQRGAGGEGSHPRRDRGVPRRPEPRQSQRRSCECLLVFSLLGAVFRSSYIRFQLENEVVFVSSFLSPIVAAPGQDRVWRSSVFGCFLGDYRVPIVTIMGSPSSWSVSGRRRGGSPEIRICNFSAPFSHESRLILFLFLLIPLSVLLLFIRIAE